MDRLFAVLNTAGNIVARGPAECAPGIAALQPTACCVRDILRRIAWERPAVYAMRGMHMWTAQGGWFSLT